MVKAVVLLMLASCELFVDVPTGMLATGDARSSDSGGGACMTSSACASPTPQCDTNLGSCVECLTSPDCAAVGAPVCAADACRGCQSDAECPSSNVCLEDGTCADPANVLYASTTGVSASCAQADPCTLDTALAMVAPMHTIIKLAAGTYERGAPASITQDTILTGEGAILHGADPQMFATMFSVTGGSFTVLNAHFELANEFAAQCTGATGMHFYRVALVGGAAGAYSTGCAAFSLDRSLVDGNSFYGFYLIGATISITNSFITNNGGSSLGGLVLSTGTTGTIEYVTLSGNNGTMGSSALRCTEPAGLTIRSSIIYGNAAPAIDASCVVGHSVIDPGYAGTGTGNLTVDPVFVAPTQKNYHLQPGSPATGLADPASMLRVDYDGDKRPQPTGTVADSGADEIP